MVPLNHSYMQTGPKFLYAKMWQFYSRQSEEPFEIIDTIKSKECTVPHTIF